MAGFLYDGAGGKEGLQVETKVQLGRGFAATISDPAHSVGNEAEEMSELGVEQGHGVAP